MLTTVPAESADATTKAPDSRGGKSSNISPSCAKKLARFCADHNWSRASAYRAIARGELKAHKRGASTVILAEDEAAWLARLPSGVKQPERLVRRRPNAA